MQQGRQTHLTEEMGGESQKSQSCLQMSHSHPRDQGLVSVLCSHFLQNNTLPPGGRRKSHQIQEGSEPYKASKLVKATTQGLSPTVQ